MPLGFQDNPGNILGTDSANNQYASTNVAANADGSIIERVEYIQTVVDAITTGNVILQGAADAGTNSTTVVAIAGLAGYGDDFFNTRFYMQILHNDDSATAAPEAEVRQITDYVSATGTFTMTAFSAAVGASDLCLILHESQVSIGRNDANNTYDSSTVAANAAGSILERLEDLKDRVDAADDYIDTEIAAIKAVTDVIPDAGALTTIDSNIDAIKDYLSGVDSVSNVLGANDNDNGFDSSNVAANADGSVLERLEAIKAQVDTVDNFIDTEVAAIQADTDKIDGATLDAAPVEGSLARFVASGGTALGTPLADSKSLVDALGTNGTTVADSAVSVLGAIGANNANNAFDSSTVAANADGSVLERLEAVKDQVGTPVGADISADIAAVKAETALIKTETDLLGAPAGATHAADIAAIKLQTDEIGAAVGASISADIAAVQADVTTIDGIVDDIKAGGGIGSGIVRKTVTFTNTAAPVPVFTVTGTVIARIVSVCTTNLESAGACNISVTAASVTLIAVTDATTVEAGDIWHDASPDAGAELTSVMKEYIIAAGNDIGMVLSAQVDSGVLEFYCIWTALSSDGAVAAA